MKGFLVCLLLVGANAQVEIRDTAALARAHALRDACPWPGARVYSVPPTGSMWPVIDHGCFVVGAVKPWKELSVGDVIAVDRPAGLTHRTAVLHRIKRKAGGGVILKGDNNDEADFGLFGPNHYLFTVYAVVRFLDVPNSSNERHRHQLSAGRLR